ncbi:MAG: hypothetical protein K2X27_26565, partial [Candidatus Obscuribacterales bacterium]|nr:hypothetical protein [Candidatus Obscuribacterales bacterium]
KKAEEHCRTALLLRPEEQDSLFILLHAQLKAGEINDAERTFDKLDKLKKSELKFSKSSLHKLLESPDFQLQIKNLTQAAENCKNGYKFLGEP